MSKYIESQVLLGLNLKWYRYQMGLTQEKFAEYANMRLSHVSRIECGAENLTCKSIDSLAKLLKVSPGDLLCEETAEKAKKLPIRIDKYTSTS